MGAGQSTPTQAPPRGLHVLRVTPSSPASETSIEPFFDFIVGFQEDKSSPGVVLNASELEKIVESHEGRTLNLLVWNSKSQETRVVPIVPSRDWALPYELPHSQDRHSKPSLLGLSMRMCEPETSLDNVWHVLDVLEGSPAESAGLVPYGDWIIGWSGGILRAEGDFYDVVESHIEKPLRVYVYSYDFDNIREVVLVPNRHWGGEGLLGCVFGFGLLHRIPPLPENREPGAIPPELLGPPEEFEEQQLFVPADINGTSHEVPEQVEEQMRWEQEEWERESYARNYYSKSNANQNLSAYVGPAEFESGSRCFDTTEDSGHNSGPGSNTSAEQEGTEEANKAIGEIQVRIIPQVSAPVPVRPIGRQMPTESSLTTVGTPRPSSFTFRTSTPTPTRPYGSLVNGVGISVRTPPWDTRMGFFDLRNGLSPRDARRVSEHWPRNHASDDELDGAASVADTDITDVSEATSGSLTSVE